MTGSYIAHLLVRASLLLFSSLRGPANSKAHTICHPASPIMSCTQNVTVDPQCGRGEMTPEDVGGRNSMHPTAGCQVEHSFSNSQVHRAAPSGTRLLYAKWTPRTNHVWLILERGVSTAIHPDSETGLASMTIFHWLYARGKAEQSHQLPACTVSVYFLSFWVCSLLWKYKQGMR